MVACVSSPGTDSYRRGRRYASRESIVASDATSSGERSFQEPAL
jgi:hypothetical protein